MQSVRRTPLAANVSTAYDASHVAFRVLRAYGWGPLLNLGYYPFGKWLTPLNFLLTPLVFAPLFFLPTAQRRLVKKSVALLDLASSRRVLDVACGRGTSSYMMASAFPQAYVTGIDLLPENVAVARTLYGNLPNLTYREGDAMRLDFPDRSFDRVLCLEGAFHFSDRAAFVSDLSRLVSAGGRVVIVDFMWKDARARDLCSADNGRMVRAIWQWQDFDSVDEYLHHAQASGFTIAACRDWSSHVTAPILTLFNCVAWLSRSAAGRALMIWHNPSLRSLTDEDWQEFRRAAHAHTELYRYAQHTALVLQR